MVPFLDGDEADGYVGAGTLDDNNVRQERPIRRRIPLDDDNLGRNSMPIELPYQKAQSEAYPAHIAVCVGIVSCPADNAEIG
jgi:hypothetical protein